MDRIVKGPGGNDVNGTLSPKKPVKMQDILTSVVTVSQDGWVLLATYRPQIKIGGFRDYDPSTETTIEGTLYVYGISKLP
jgi:hypothetical protein